MIGSREPRSQRLRAGASGPENRLERAAEGLLSLLLVLSLLVLPGSAPPCQALGLPGRSPRPAAEPALPLTSSTPSGLQEVAPPLAVQQLQEALAEREPRIEILAPADDSLLPPGPWTLRLRVQDWPLVDGGPLGLGTHLVAQLDDEPPRRLTSSEITLPELAPGSHRLTVFAARPWGEAAKNPGAWSQVRLHRTAANPLALPQAGQAQLIAVSPPAAMASEPLLLDWLLLDAPLQNLRRDDGRWRLRVTINGDGFVIDRQTPLWLKGWKPGRNAIRLELLDGRGEPLSPPFNSLVREVELGPTQPAARWQQGPLDAGELAILLGEATAAALQSDSGIETKPPISKVSAMAQPGDQAPGSAPTAAADARAATKALPNEKATAATINLAETEAGAAPLTSGAAEPTAASLSPAPPTPVAPPLSRASEQAGTGELTAQGDTPGAPEDTASPSTPRQLNPSATSAASSEPAQPDGFNRLQLSPSQPDPSPDLSARPGSAAASGSSAVPPQSDPGPPELLETGSQPSAAAAGIPIDRAPALPPPGTPPLAAESAAGQDAAASQAAGTGSLPAPPPLPMPTTLPVPPTADLKQEAAATAAIAADSLRLRPSSSLGGSAREQVNPDGTMIKPPRRGPLTGLRERLLP